MLAVGHLEGRRRRAPRTGAVGRRAGASMRSIDLDPRGRRRARAGRPGPRRACPSAMRRPKSSTTTRSQTAITRSMWCSTSSTDVRPSSSRISSAELVHVVLAEAAGRLVEQQQLRARDQRAGQRDPLLDAVGQAARAAGRRRRRRRASSSAASARSRSARSSRSERGRPSSADSEAGPRVALGADHHVLEHGQPGEQPDALQRAGDAEPGELVRADAVQRRRRRQRTLPRVGRGRSRR